MSRPNPKRIEEMMCNYNVVFGSGHQNTCKNCECAWFANLTQNVQNDTGWCGSKYSILN